LRACGLRQKSLYRCYIARYRICNVSGTCLLVFVELEAAPYAGDNHIAITCGTNSAVMYLGPRVTSLTSGKDKNRDRRVCSSALNG